MEVRCVCATEIAERQGVMGDTGGRSQNKSGVHDDGLRTQLRNNVDETVSADSLGLECVSSLFLNK